jgi:hypothetical protein
MSETSQERFLRWMLRVIGVLALVVLAVVASTESVPGQSSALIPWTVLTILVASACLLGASDAWRYGVFIGVVALALSVGGMISGLILVFIGGTPREAVPAFAIAIVGYGLLLALVSARRAHEDLMTFDPFTLAVVVARAEMAFGGQGPVIPPGELARMVDAHAAGLPTSTRLQLRYALLATALSPMLSFQVPLPLMGAAGRERWLRSMQSRRRPNTLRAPYRAALRYIDDEISIVYFRDPRVLAVIGAQVPGHGPAA